MLLCFNLQWFGKPKLANTAAAYPVFIAKLKQLKNSTFGVND